MAADNRINATVLERNAFAGASLETQRPPSFGVAAAQPARPIFKKWRICAELCNRWPCRAAIPAVTTSPGGPEAQNRPDGRNLKWFWVPGKRALAGPAQAGLSCRTASDAGPSRAA